MTIALFTSLGREPKKELASQLLWASSLGVWLFLIQIASVRGFVLTSHALVYGYAALGGLAGIGVAAGLHEFVSSKMAEKIRGMLHRVCSIGTLLLFLIGISTTAYCLSEVVPIFGGVSGLAIMDAQLVFGVSMIVPNVVEIFSPVLAFCGGFVWSIEGLVWLLTMPRITSQSDESTGNSLKRWVLLRYCFVAVCFFIGLTRAWGWNAVLLSGHGSDYLIVEFIGADSLPVVGARLLFLVAAGVVWAILCCAVMRFGHRVFRWGRVGHDLASALLSALFCGELAFRVLTRIFPSLYTMPPSMTDVVLTVHIVLVLGIVWASFGSYAQLCVSPSALISGISDRQDDPIPLQGLLEKAPAELVNQFVACGLSEREQIAVCAHLMGVSSAEVGEYLGIAHSTVRTYTARGRKKLGDKYKACTQAFSSPASSESWASEFEQSQRQRAQAELDNCLVLSRMFGCFCWLAGVLLLLPYGAKSYGTLTLTGVTVSLLVGAGAAFLLGRLRWFMSDLLDQLPRLALRMVKVFVFVLGGFAGICVVMWRLHTLGLSNWMLPHAVVYISISLLTTFTIGSAVRAGQRLTRRGFSQFHRVIAGVICCAAGSSVEESWRAVEYVPFNIILFLSLCACVIASCAWLFSTHSLVSGVLSSCAAFLLLTWLLRLSMSAAVLLCCAGPLAVVYLRTQLFQADDGEKNTRQCAQQDNSDHTLCSWDWCIWFAGGVAMGMLAANHWGWLHNVMTYRLVVSWYAWLAGAAWGLSVIAAISLALSVDTRVKGVRLARVSTADTAQHALSCLVTRGLSQEHALLVFDLALGMSIEEVAQKHSYSSSYVARVRTQAYRLLGIATRSQLVRIVEALLTSEN